MNPNKWERFENSVLHGPLALNQIAEPMMLPEFYGIAPAWAFFFLLWIHCPKWLLSKPLAFSVINFELPRGIPNLNEYSANIHWLSSSANIFLGYFKYCFYLKTQMCIYTDFLICRWETNKQGKWEALWLPVLYHHKPVHTSQAVALIRTAVQRSWSSGKA